jgi:hypothetical protein
MSRTFKVLLFGGIMMFVLELAGSRVSSQQQGACVYILKISINPQSYDTPEQISN